VHEHLGGRFRIGQGSVAGLRRDSEEVRERREADAAEPPFEQAPRERSRAERRLGETPVAQLPLEEALVEARVVRHEELVPGEGEEPPHDSPGRRRALELLFANTGQAGNRLGQRDARIDERLKRLDELEPAHADRADLADLVAPGREPGRFEIEDDEFGLLEQRVGAAVDE
jgi:hypothetical protein